MAMLTTEMTTLARIRPSVTVMALPSTGKKAKNPIHAPCPAMKRWARSIFSGLIFSHRSIHSRRPRRPMP